jgi:hypothetical protein
MRKSCGLLAAERIASRRGTRLRVSKRFKRFFRMRFGFNALRRKRAIFTRDDYKLRRSE